MFKVTVIVVFIDLLFFFAGCATRSASDTNIDVADTLTAERITPVQVSISRKGTFYYRIACNGNIRAAATYQVNAQTGGIINVCNARDGSFFMKGDLILNLETVPIQIQLEKAESALLSAQGEYQSRLLGYKSLLEGKSSQEVKVIKAKLQAETGLSQAELEVKNTQWQLEQAVIRAPESVICANTKVNAGMHVNVGTPLFTLYTANDLFADVMVLEEDAGQVHTGQKANVIPLGMDNKAFRATVRSINPIVDGNGMVTVHLKLQETKGLVPGMHISAIIEVPKHEAVIVPKSALVLRSGERPVVFTVKNALSQWHYVKPGLDNGKEVEILDGISSGDTVITSNNIQLAHNAPVSVQK